MKEVLSGQTQRWDVSKKKLMKEYADKRRKINAWESSIVIGDTVLLKQNRAYKLTPTYDPSPYSVIGVKGTMVAVKIGREIKAQDLSQCKVLKYTREKENGPGNTQALQGENYVGCVPWQPLIGLSSQFARDGSSTTCRGPTSNWWPCAVRTQKVRRSSNFHTEHFV